MIAVDANFLPLLLAHPVEIPEDPATGKPITHLAERIEFLIKRCDETNETFIIPTPVLSEFLVLVKGDGNKYLGKVERSPLYEIKAFDKRAAIELAAMRLKIHDSLCRNEQKRQGAQGTWAKISFDRQLVAIAKAHNAHTIYSDDKNVKTFADRFDIKVTRTWELPIPAADAQITIHEILDREEAKATVSSGPSESGSKVLKWTGRDSNPQPTE